MYLSKMVNSFMLKICYLSFNMYCVKITNEILKICCYFNMSCVKITNKILKVCYL